MNEENYYKGIKKVNMYEAIANRLEEMIISDIIRVDEKLPSEQILAINFGVSRPVIREALMLLKARGLVEQKNGEGAFISQPSPENMTDTVRRIIQIGGIDMPALCEVRVALEALSATLASEKAQKKDLDALRQINRQMTESRNDLARRAELDVLFHVKIAEAGGNRLLIFFINSLASQLSEMIEKNLTLEGAAEDGERYHERIIDAISTQDAEVAEELMRNHIVMSMRNHEIIAKKTGGGSK
jgi:GntR family transcriptional repressor for pyruvate dehydrogenase complex